MDFVVRPDGSVVGSDGAAGSLAAALPYTGRLARRVGELVDIGDLRAMEASGRRRLEVGVTWTPADEATYRATVEVVEPRAVPHFTVVGAVDTAAAVAHCLDRLMSVDGVRWVTLVTAASRVVGARGERQELHHLAEVGTRVLAVLRSLEDQHASGFVRLRYEQGAVLGASVGRHAVVARVAQTDDAALLTVIDEVRAVLATHDLTAVASEVDPGAVDAAPQPAPQPAPQQAPPAPPPLVGARFAGAGERQPRAPRRRLFGGR